MNRVFLGKAITFTLCIFYELPLLGFVLFVGLGHVFDVATPLLKRKFTAQQAYQQNSEKLIFLLSYAIFYLNLDKKEAENFILDNVIILPQQKKSVLDLLKYYTDVFIPRYYGKNTSKINQKFQDALKMLKINAGDVVSFFSLIEMMLKSQSSKISDSQYDVLDSIAKRFNISYIRSVDDSVNYNEQNYQQENTYTYKESYKEEKVNNQQKSYNFNSNFFNDFTGASDSDDLNYGSESMSKEVYDSFKVFDVEPDSSYTLDYIKKVYKNELKKNHPDILKGQGLSDIKIKKAEEKVICLNKSFEIIKNYLANG